MSKNKMKINKLFLNKLCERINKMTGAPLTCWTKTSNGLKANIGHYYIELDLNLVGLSQIMNEGGGVNTIFGLTTKKELYAKMHAFIDGMTAKQDTQELMNEEI